MRLPQLTDEDVEAARILMSFRRAPKAGTDLPAAVWANGGGSGGGDSGGGCGCGVGTEEAAVEDVFLPEVCGVVPCPGSRCACYCGEGGCLEAVRDGGEQCAEFRFGHAHRRSNLDICMADADTNADAAGEREARGEVSECETEIEQTARFGITPEGKACLVFS